MQLLDLVAQTQDVSYTNMYQRAQGENVKRQRQEAIQQHIQSDAVNKNLNLAHQNRHIPGSRGFIEGRSYLFEGVDVQALIDQYHGTGEIRFNKSGGWINKEFITHNRDIGIEVNPVTGVETITNRFSIHYSKRGAHIVPARRLQ